MNPFPEINPDSPLLLVLAPAVLMAAWAGVVLLVFEKPPDWLRLPIGLVLAGFQAAYLSFRLVGTLSFDTAADGLASVLFFASEAFIHFRIALGNLSLFRLTDRSAQADESERLVRTGTYLPTVDIFVPTYSEPVEMLRRTIIGCQAIEYPRKTVYLLDDQRRAAMRELARELGCQYLDRPDNRHAKAGNLNHALPLTNGELILCFDADFVPTTDFLKRTVGFFRNPEVALVQTPQNFFNEDAITRNLGLDNALEDEQRLFFRTLQPGRDSVNAVVCHGSCFVVRRTALVQIGGVPTETITEDWATSIKLQSAGYKLYYLNEALSAGVSADRSGEFVQQRSRWAQGTLQALFATTNPLTVPGLSWKQRVMHFAGVLYYVGSLSSMFNLIAPLLYLFWGIHLLRMNVAEIVFYRLPFTIGFYMLYSWLTRRTRSAIWTEIYEAFLAPCVAATVLRTFVKPFGAGFRVTDKVQRRQSLSVNRRVAMPFLVLGALHLLGLGFAIWSGKPLDESEAFYIAAYFAVGNLGTLWLCCLVSCDVAQENRFVRFKHELPCMILWEDTGFAAETVFLSEGDVVFKPRGKIALEELPAEAVLYLPAFSLDDAPIKLKSITADRCITAEFGALTLSQRRALIKNLFCRPRQWDRPPRSEIRAFWEYFRAPLRMYPLAE